MFLFPLEWKRKKKKKKDNNLYIKMLNEVVNKTNTSKNFYKNNLWYFILINIAYFEDHNPYKLDRPSGWLAYHRDVAHQDSG